jgi:hypothetical protein
MITITHTTDILANRLALVELELIRHKKILEQMQGKIDTIGIRGERDKFITREAQGEGYLQATLTPEEIAQLKSNKRHDNLTQMRRQVVVELYKRGLTPNQIARLLCKDHNSIHYHLIMAGMKKPICRLTATRLGQYKAKMRLKANSKRLQGIQ